MIKIVSLQCCFMFDKTGDLEVKTEPRIDLANIEYTRTKEQYIALAYRLLHWSEIGQKSPVTETVIVEDTDTGECRILNYDFSTEYLQEI